MTKLDALLNKIHPSVLFKDVEVKINNAVTSVFNKLSSNTVDYHDCQNILAEFYRSVSDVIEGEITKPKDWMQSGKAFDLLESKYGQPANILDIMTSGLQGGVYEVLRNSKRHAASRMRSTTHC